MLFVDKYLQLLKGKKKTVLIGLKDLKDSYYVKIKKETKDTIFDQILQDIQKGDKLKILANMLQVGRITVYLMIKGYNTQTNKETYIRVSVLKRLSKLTKIPVNDIENSVTDIKFNRSSRSFKIHMPIKVTLDSKDYLIRRLAEDYWEDKLLNEFDKLNSSNNLPDAMLKEDGYLLLFPQILIRNSNYELSLSKRKGKIILDNSKIVLKYVNTNIGEFVEKIIPQKIIIDEKFAKEFGKWLGDRFGGNRIVGLANTNFNLLLDFQNFLTEELGQHNKQLRLWVQYKGVVDKDEIERRLKKRFNLEIKFQKHKGFRKRGLVYMLGINHASLKYFVFDYLEKYWDVILLNSPLSVREAYYAGLFEAEGGFDPAGMEPNISQACGWKSKMDFINLKLLIILFHYYLLAKDKFQVKMTKGLSRNVARDEEMFYYLRFKNLNQFYNRIMKWMNKNFKWYIHISRIIRGM